MKKLITSIKQGFTALLISLLVGIAPAPAFAYTTDSTDDGSAGTIGTAVEAEPVAPAESATEQQTTSSVITDEPTATVPPSDQIADEASISQPSSQTDQAVTQPISEANEEAPTQSQDQQSSGDTTINNQTAVSNTVTADAQTGNVDVVRNDNIGTISTGDALSSATLINLLQSQTSLNGTGVATFTKDIQGDVSGDFLIDPSAMVQSASNTGNNLQYGNVTLNNNASIVNNLTLTAGSGNATATENDNIGSITTGNATAVANVINMINSVVAANQSFIGTINIYGNYQGNVLLPQNSLNALLQSNGTVSTGQLTDSTANTASDAKIINNVQLSAASGNATVLDNDNIGSIASGNGMTNLTILNMTNRKVVAANSLLVFVNVMGSWVGLIMDAPAGTTAAALGGGVVASENGGQQASSSANVNSSDKATITNNITATAQTGNALATGNDDIGSISTGNALASANIANVVGSNFSLSNWFGVLFINVFGNWKGNFGTVKPPVIAPITSGGGMGAGSDFMGGEVAKVFAFVPTGSGASSSLGLKSVPASVVTTNDTPSSTNSQAVADKAGQILGTKTTDSTPKGPTAKLSKASQNIALSVAAIAIGVLGILYLVVDRLRGRRQFTSTK